MKIINDSRLLTPDSLIPQCLYRIEPRSPDSRTQAGQQTKQKQGFLHGGRGWSVRPLCRPAQTAAVLDRNVKRPRKRTIRTHGPWRPPARWLTARPSRFPLCIERWPILKHPKSAIGPLKSLILIHPISGMTDL